MQIGDVKISGTMRFSVMVGMLTFDAFTFTQVTFILFIEIALGIDRWRATEALRASEARNAANAATSTWADATTAPGATSTGIPSTRATTTDHTVDSGRDSNRICDIESSSTSVGPGAPPTSASGIATRPAASPTWCRSSVRTDRSRSQDSARLRVRRSWGYAR